MRYPPRRRACASGEVEARPPRTALAVGVIVAASALCWQGSDASAGAGVGVRHATSAAAHLRRVQGQGPPALNVSKIILAEPATETALPIQVGPADTIARNSFIRLRGLPPAAALSEGHAIAPGAWAVPIIALANLRILLPIGLTGKSEITVALVTVDGTVMAETKTALVIAAASLIAPSEPEQRSKSVASLGSGGMEPPRTDDRTARPTAPPLAIEEQKRALAFIAKGNEQLAQGNIAAARLFFQRAADVGLAQGAFAMAATYDPVELERLGARSVLPDTQAARRWYERARQLGDGTAEERLNRLGAR